MKKPRFHRNLLRLPIVAICASAALTPVPASAQHGSLVRAVMHSRSLEHNRLGDSPDRSVFVYLPAAYLTEPQRRFPVAYLLHGVGDSNADWINGQYQGMVLPDVLDSLIATGTLQPLIVVMPDASNAYQGCFYTNSSVTGNWEDFVVHDLVDFVDTNYRTYPRPASRGLIGHSMGGYGALKLAMEHPEVFATVYALSPCCIEWAADFSGTNTFWPKTIAMRTIDRQAETEFYPKFFISIATAWSPNPDRPPFLVDLPFSAGDSGVVPAEPAYSKWTANLLLPLARGYRANLGLLRGLALDYGRHDQFPHIPIGSQAIDSFLTQIGITHQLEAYEGDHFNQVRVRLTAHALPFISARLAGQ